MHVMCAFRVGTGLNSNTGQGTARQIRGNRTAYSGKSEGRRGNTTPIRPSIEWCKGHSSDDRRGDVDVAG